MALLDAATAGSDRGHRRLQQQQHVQSRQNLRRAGADVPHRRARLPRSRRRRFVTGRSGRRRRPSVREEVTRGWLPAGPIRLGLTAGASTPNNIVGQVIERLRTSWLDDGRLVNVLPASRRKFRRVTAQKFRSKTTRIWLRGAALVAAATWTCTGLTATGSSCLQATQQRNARRDVADGRAALDAGTPAIRSAAAIHAGFPAVGVVERRQRQEGARPVGRQGRRRSTRSIEDRVNAAARRSSRTTRSRADVLDKMTAERSADEATYALQVCARRAAAQPSCSRAGR